MFISLPSVRLSPSVSLVVGSVPSDSFMIPSPLKSQIMPVSGLTQTQSGNEPESSVKSSIPSLSVSSTLGSVSWRLTSSPSFNPSPSESGSSAFVP